MKMFAKTSQLSMFDLPQAVAAADRGVELAADQKASLVIKARDIAIDLAKRNGTVTADDVQFALAQQNVSIKALGNSAGAIFRDRRFVFTGRMEKSKRIHSHGNLLRVWRLA